jgi:hypothetical protein
LRPREGVCLDTRRERVKRGEAGSRRPSIALFFGNSFKTLGSELRARAEKCAAACLNDALDAGACGRAGATFTGQSHPAIDLPRMLKISQFSIGLDVVSQA